MRCNWCHGVISKNKELKEKSEASFEVYGGTGYGYYKEGGYYHVECWREREEWKWMELKGQMLWTFFIIMAFVTGYIWINMSGDEKLNYYALTIPPIITGILIYFIIKRWGWRERLIKKKINKNFEKAKLSLNLSLIEGAEKKGIKIPKDIRIEAKREAIKKKWGKDIWGKVGKYDICRNCEKEYIDYYERAKEKGTPFEKEYCEWCARKLFYPETIEKIKCKDCGNIDYWYIDDGKPSGITTCWKCELKKQEKRKELEHQEKIRERIKKEKEKNK